MSTLGERLAEVLRPGCSYDARLSGGIVAFFLVAALALQLTLFVLMQTFLSPLTILGLLTGVLLLLLTAFSPERVLLVLVVYMCVLPLANYLERFPILPVGYTSRVGSSLFLLLVFYWVIYVSLKKPSVSMSSLDWAILAFIVVSFVSASTGLARGHRLSFWKAEFIPLVFYSVYFVVLSLSPPDRTLRIFFDIILITSVIAALEIGYSLRYTEGLLLARIGTRHVHLAQLSVPYIGAVLVFSSSRRRKLLAGLALFPIVGMIIISQQRALWGSIFVAALAVMALAAFSRNTTGRRFGLIILTVLVGLSFLAGSLFVIHRLTGSAVGLTLLKRALVFLRPGAILTDPSTAIRLRTFEQALGSLKGEVLFGKGIGAFFFSNEVRYRVNFVDNTYVQLLWKMGVVGLISYLVVAFLVFRRCTSVFRSSRSESARIISTTVGLNLAGMMIVALTNSSLVIYRFTFVWAITFAAVELTYRRLRMQIQGSESACSCRRLR